MKYFPRSDPAYATLGIFLFQETFGLQWSSQMPPVHFEVLTAAKSGKSGSLVLKDLLPFQVFRRSWMTIYGHRYTRAVYLNY